MVPAGLRDHPGRRRDPVRRDRGDRRASPGPGRCTPGRARDPGRIPVNAAQVDAIDAAVTTELEATLLPIGGEIVRVARSGSFAPAGAARDDPSVLVELAAFEAIADHATLVAGDWEGPLAGDIGATLSEGAAAALGLGVGDTIDLESRVGAGTPVRVVMTGIWRPDRTDPYWLESPLELDGTRTTGRFTTRGPFVVSREALLGLESGRAVAARVAGDPGPRSPGDRPGRRTPRTHRLARGPGRRRDRRQPAAGHVRPAGHARRGRTVHPRQPQRHHAVDDPVRRARRLRDRAGRRDAPRTAPDRPRPDALPRRLDRASRVHGLDGVGHPRDAAGDRAIPLAALVVYLLGSVGPARPTAGSATPSRSPPRSSR